MSYFNFIAAMIYLNKYFTGVTVNNDSPKIMIPHSKFPGK